MQAIFKRLSQTPHNMRETRVAVESGPCTFYYMLDGNTCFLTLAEKGYPKKLAFQYLEELAGEFSRLYGGQVDAITRPYAFIKFGARARLVRSTVSDIAAASKLSWYSSAVHCRCAAAGYEYSIGWGRGSSSAGIALLNRHFLPCVFP
jgi:vesicle transport protein SEC22